MKLFENIGTNKFKLIHEDHNETDMSNPDEKREVQIARAILRAVRMMSPPGNVAEIRKLANELLKMHGVKNADGSKSSPYEPNIYKNKPRPWDATLGAY